MRDPTRSTRIDALNGSRGGLEVTTLKWLILLNFGHQETREKASDGGHVFKRQALGRGLSTTAATAARHLDLGEADQEALATGDLPRPVEDLDFDDRDEFRPGRYAGLRLSDTSGRTHRGERK